MILSSREHVNSKMATSYHAVFVISQDPKAMQLPSTFIFYPLGQIQGSRGSEPCKSKSKTKQHTLGLCFIYLFKCTKKMCQEKNIYMKQEA